MAIIKNTLNVVWGEDSRVLTLGTADNQKITYGMLLTIDGGKFKAAADATAAMYFVAQNSYTNLDAISGYSADSDTAPVAGSVRITAYPIVADAIVEVPEDLVSGKIAVGDEVKAAGDGKWTKATAPDTGADTVCGMCVEETSGGVAIMLYKSSVEG